jgi:uncharacterized membrane protein (DUF2068 family)
LKKETPKKELRAIACFKLVKSLLLLGTGAGLLALLHQDLAARLEHVVNALHADPNNRIVHGFIVTAGVMDVHTLEKLSAGTLVYGTLALAEGIGLWLAMWWAPYLAIVATSLFIPVEMYTLSQQFSMKKLAVLAINVAIVWYLVEHLKAEQGHSGHPRARAAVVE